MPMLWSFPFLLASLFAFLGQGSFLPKSTAVLPCIRFLLFLRLGEAHKPTAVFGPGYWLILRNQKRMKTLWATILLMREAITQAEWTIRLLFCQVSLIKLSSSFTLKLISAFNALNTLNIVSMVALLALLSSLEI
jgi:hypothetical protein